jgi:hypothetical protein
MLGSYRIRPLTGLLLGLLFIVFPAAAQRPEALTYRVEWLRIHAGNARLSWSPATSEGSHGWQANLDLESVGLVSKFYKVDNHYSSTLDDQLCVQSTLLKARERGGERETQVTFDRERRKAVYLERDLAKKRVVDSHEIDIPACVCDVIGALQRLRAMRLESGQSAELPVSDGKKSILAKVEAQEREAVKTRTGSYKTIRYEAFLFNNVLYRRKGRLFVWLTDDDRRLPVQIRMRLSLPVGTVTLQLEKEGKI